MARTNKIAFVGPKAIQEYFPNLDETWDAQSPVETVADFRRELEKDDEESAISSETQLIILFSRLFPNERDEFAEVVATYAPYAVTCIITPDSEKYVIPEIDNKIKQVQRDKANIEPGYNSETPYYFISYENARSDIYDAVYNFLRSPIIDEEIKEAVRPLSPIANEIEEITEDGEWGKSTVSNPDEPIYIPEDDPDEELGKVISVTSAKGGTGKSTITMLLSTYIKKAGDLAYQNGDRNQELKVVVVDMDVRDGQLGFLNGEVRPSVINIFIEDPNPTPEVVKKGIFHNQRTGVDFIFAAKTPRSSNEIPSSFYVQLINSLKRMYDIVILDTSVNYMDPLLEGVAYPMSDEIVYVSEFSIQSIFGMNRWISENTNMDNLSGKSVPREKINIVLNKSLQEVSISISQIEKAADGLPIVAVLPSSPRLVVYSSNTLSIDQVLNEPGFRESTADIVDAVVPELNLPKIQGV